jgi:subtilisin family serine protease
MVRRLSQFSVLLVVLMVTISFSSLVLCSFDANSNNFVYSNTPEKKDVFTPTVQKQAQLDQDNNKIVDTLDREILERSANGTAQNEVSVTVMLKTEPTKADVDDFVSAGGQLTTSIWTEATYGFGGTIAYAGIGVFGQKCSNLLLVEKETEGEACVAYAAQQVGARPYTWKTLGLQGDPNSSIAFLDTGIDPSHPDFSPGYGSQNFSNKIVGWQDFINSTNSPFDDDGHGSHVAGLAAGNGFSSVDPSGYTTATWKQTTNVSSTSTSMMVNSSGPITLSINWSSTGTAQVSALTLYRSGKSITSWSQMTSISASTPNTWSTLTYNVASIPAGGYDTYNPSVSIISGTGNITFTVNMSWPYTQPSDNFSAWTGLAPQSKIVSVKVLNSTGSGLSNQLTNGINWIISNRVRYHITVASLSISFDTESSQVDQAIYNLVNSGVTTVISAGNNKTGGNYIYSPGSVDEAITVAAMNQFDNIAHYSSQGGTSRYSGKTTKPDILAPGGSAYAVELYSADAGAKDAAPMRGTSMAAPIIAGCIQDLIQAMGGYANWNYTKGQALQPKMILLMTATETYPNPREQDPSSSYSPTLERGGKDVTEGFGRVNLDAAVDAVLKSYTVGNAVSDSLGIPPTTADISVLGQKLDWARNVQLSKGYLYNFSINVPAGADYDLYLYNITGTSYGDPVIAAKSANPTTGGSEQFYFIPTTTGTYYVVVKRATETNGSGNFTLTSSQSIANTTVVLNTPGLTNASNVVHYIQNGIAKSGNIVAGTFSDVADVATNLTIDNPLPISSTQRYTTTQPTFEVQADVINYTATFRTEYYLSIVSLYATKPSESWYGNGTNATPALSTGTVDQQNGTRRVFASWSGDSSGTNYQAGATIYMNAPKIVIANWAIQYQISYTATPSTGGTTTPNTSSWITPGTVSIAASPSNNYQFSGWSSTTGDITFTNPETASTTANINGPGTINANFVLGPTTNPTPISTTKPTTTPTTITNMPQPNSTNTSPSPSIPEIPAAGILALAAVMITLALIAVSHRTILKSEQLKLNT